MVGAVEVGSCRAVGVVVVVVVEFLVEEVDIEAAGVGSW